MKVINDQTLHGYREGILIIIFVMRASLNDKNGAPKKLQSMSGKLDYIFFFCGAGWVNFLNNGTNLPSASSLHNALICLSIALVFA